MLILAANILVVLPNKKNVKPKFSVKGVVLRILCSVVVSVALTIDAKISPNFSVAFYGFLLNFFPGIICTLAARLTPQQLISEIKLNYKGVLITGSLAVLSYGAILQAFSMTPKSIVNSITNLTSIFLVIFGILFLKETDSIKRKVFAVLIAFLGALIVSNS